MQIADYISDNILEAKLKEGDRIPSVREMASQVEVNPNTVARTYSYLQEKEIIFNKRGVGYFIAADALVKTRDLKKDAFLKQYLPDFLKMIKLLDLNLKDIEKLAK